MHHRELIRRLAALADRPLSDFSMRIAVTDEPVPFEAREGLEYREIRLGESWGRLFSCAWLRLEGRVDPSLVDERLHLEIDLNCEALLFGADGVPLQGFTNGSSNFGFLGSLGSPARRHYPIADLVDLEDLVDGKARVTLWLDAGMNDLFGNVKKGGRVETVRMVRRDPEAIELRQDVECLVDLARVAGRRDREAGALYRRALREIARAFDGGDAGPVAAARAIAARALRARPGADHQVSAIGHAHLDLAWLWPLRETRRKGARTFANALRIMERHPDYRFGASQAQLYEWIRDEHPALFEEVRRRVAEGRWEVQGGMWVEADTNITGEESLVRQMLHGIRFFRKEFGLRMDLLWLPDVFGYSGNMPQIMRRSGLDRFMTIKISWNDTTKFPHHSFNWEGIDGSTVLAHMPPEGEYNSPADARWLLKSMENYRERALGNETLCLFGVGDGGGGPTEAHVGRIERLSGAAPLPRVRMEGSKSFFDRLMAIRDRLPTWKGELYLEKHRGTYTSQGRVKYWNNRMERKLRTLETLLSQAGGYEARKPGLERIWKEVLLYQFHDILPGSSINRVYDECLARYEALDRELDEMARAVLGAAPDRLEPATEPGAPLPKLSAYNPLPVEALVTRVVGTRHHELRVAPLSARVTGRRSWERAAANDARRLENERLRVRLRGDGSLASVYDKVAEREVLAPGGERLREYLDYGNAWDILRHYGLLPSRAARLVSAEAFAYGPVGEIVQRFRLGRSTVVRTLRLEPESPRLDVELEVDWQGHRRMLRAEYALAARSDRAAFDIQFGHLYRSTRNDSPAERAQYEVPAQAWADLSDGRHGAALLTEGKHGFRAKGGSLELDLIRSTDHPARRSDLGPQRIRYALLAHEGGVEESGVDAASVAFNAWFPVFEGESPAALVKAPFELEGEAVALTCVKGSEDGDDLVLRLHERHGAKARAILRFSDPVAAISEADLLEENPLPLGAGPELRLDFGPFEIKTLRVSRRRDTNPGRQA